MNNKFEAAGTILAIMDTQQITDTFKKREFVLEIPDGNYSQTVKFQTVQDKTDLIEEYDIGQKIKVYFNLRGREYTRKSDGAMDYWLNLECWRIELEDGDFGGKQTDISQAAPDHEEISRDDYIDVPF